MPKIQNKTRKKYRGGATVFNTPIKTNQYTPFAPQKSKQQSSRINNGQSVRRLINMFEEKARGQPLKQSEGQQIEIEYGNTENIQPSIAQYNAQSINNKFIPYQKVVQELKSNQVKLLPGSKKRRANTRKLNKSAQKAINQFEIKLQPHITNTQKAKNITYRPKLKNVQNQLGRATRRLIPFEE
jgi:hypothetical protein